MEFDIIGDVHGHHLELTALLDELGYQFRHGAYRHSNPDRKVIFLGDLMDRGPGQLETLETARRMIDADTAHVIMGNHEHGAIGWFYRDPLDPARYLRNHGSKNLDQHVVFLNAVGDDRELHREWIEWMQTMPLFLDLPELRCIHACWHPRHVEAIRSLSGPVDGVLDQDALFDSFRKGKDLKDTVDILLRGPEIDLPDGFGFHDHAGQHRTKSRVRWWDDTVTSLRNGAITDLVHMPDLPEVPLSDDCIFSDPDDRPVFFGHYWFAGQPALVSPRRTCLDFSVAKEGGVLCAYTWRGESDLTEDHLFWLDERKLTLSA